HGERAREDKYLELYGILPTLELMRARFRRTASLDCAKQLDLQPFIAYRGLIVHEDNSVAHKAADEYANLKKHVERMMAEQQVSSPDALDTAQLDERDK